MLLPLWDSDNVYQVSRDHFSCKVHGFNQRNRFKCIFLAPCQCIVLFDQQTSPTPPLIVGVTDFVLCASLKLLSVYSGRDTHTLHLFSGAAFTEKVTLGFLDRWGQMCVTAGLPCHYSGTSGLSASPNKPKDTAAVTAGRCVYKWDNNGSHSVVSAQPLAVCFYKPTVRKTQPQPRDTRQPLNIQLENKNMSVMLTETFRALVVCWMTREGDGLYPLTSACFLLSTCVPSTLMLWWSYCTARGREGLLLAAVFFFL